MNTISYLVLTNGEPQTVNLLNYLKRHKDFDDEIVVLIDGCNEHLKTCLDALHQELGQTFKTIYHKLDYSYSEHRNAALPHCKGDYIFALDADEVPTEMLLANLKELFDIYQADLYWLPRLNIFEGVTAEDAAKFGWKVENGNVVNWPDMQTRLFRNDGKLKWHGNLHERIKTLPDTKQIQLTPSTHYCIVHRKDIDRQLADNARYNAVYTVKENMGEKC